MNPPRINTLALAGKVLTYIGILFVAMGLFGGYRPHQQLVQSTKIVAKVLKNDIIAQQNGAYMFQLQLSYRGSMGEQRTSITTPVRAANEAAARRSYRGRNVIPGQTYAFPTSTDDPDRVEPFLAYDWQTFGNYIVLTIAGFAAFVAGVIITRKGRARRG